MTIHKNDIFTDTEEEEGEEDLIKEYPVADQTDDEHALSLSSSPSPVHSEESDDYLDPDLYCLRRSDRQKPTTNNNVSLRVPLFPSFPC